MAQKGLQVSKNARDVTIDRQCTAKNRAGNRCGKRPIIGGTVCAAHGGAAPKAKEAARRRLIELIDPAIAVLHDEMQNAENSRDRISAANSILDRAGITKGADSDLETARTILIERLIALRGNQAIEQTAVSITQPQQRELETSVDYNDDDEYSDDYYDDLDE